MSRRDEYPAGVPCFVDTLTADLEAAKGFYGGIFGWNFAGPGPMPGDPPGEYFVARVDGDDVAGVGTRQRVPCRARSVAATATEEKVTRRGAIAANDDAIRSVRLILQAISQTITQGRAEFESKRARKVEETPAEGQPAPVTVPAAEAAVPAAA